MSLSKGALLLTVRIVTERRLRLLLRLSNDLWKQRQQLTHDFSLTSCCESCRCQMLGPRPHGP